MQKLQRNTRPEKANGIGEAEKSRFQFFLLGLAATAAISLGLFSFTSYDFEIRRDVVDCGPGEIFEPIEATLTPPERRAKTKKQKPITTAFTLLTEIPIQDDKPEEKLDLTEIPFDDSGDDDEFSNLTLPDFVPTGNFSNIEMAPFCMDCQFQTDEQLRRACTEATLVRMVQLNCPYPKSASEAGIEGTTQISFVVDEFGNVTHVEIARS